MSVLKTPTPSPPQEQPVVLSSTTAGTLVFYPGVLVSETSTALRVRVEASVVDEMPTGTAVGVVLPQHPAPFMLMATSSGRVHDDGGLELTRGRPCV